MNNQRAWTLVSLTLVALTIAISPVQAQFNDVPSAGFSPYAMQQGAEIMPASMYMAAAAQAYSQQGLPPGMGYPTSPGTAPMVHPGYMPVGYESTLQPVSTLSPVSGGCHQCGGGGCQACTAGPETDSLGGGGCCTPRWFDIHAEWMFLTRDDVSDRFDFASAGNSGPIVLSTDDLDFDFRTGFRVTAALLIGPGNNLEGSYFGGFNWEAAAEVTDATDDLHSVFSNYGNTPFGGFLETDQASLQRIEYNSQLHNVEMNFRHRWVSDNCNYHGSWILGARYFRLDEDFIYTTHADVHTDPNTMASRGPGDMVHRTATTNDLIGFQAGGDLFVCMTPRLKVGGEIEAGIFGNQASQDTFVGATSINPVVQENASNTGASLLAEAGLTAIFRVTPRFTLRGGYQLLYVNGVALAPDNFNNDPPFLAPLVGNRPVSVNDNGRVFYHGATVGFEWTW